MEEIKFTQDELDNIKYIQAEYQQLIYKLGRVELEKKMIQLREDQLNQDYDAVLSSEKKLIESLNEKYGTGTLNLENGTFTPTS